MRRAGADGVFLGGTILNHGTRLIADLRAVLGPDVELLSPDAFNLPATIVEEVGRGAEGFVTAIATPPNDDLPATGRRWAADFERRFGQKPCCYSVHHAQALMVMLDALAGSDGSREAVMRRLLGHEVRGGLLGDFRIDAHGDTTLNTLALYRIRGGKLKFERAITPPAELLTRR